MTVAEGGQDSPLLAGLQAGGLAGVGGLIVGGTVGILRSKTPVLWAAATTIQWALLGGSYWGLRNAILNGQKKADPSSPIHIDGQITPIRKVWISGIAGGLSFAVVGAVTRGRQNVIPGTIMGSIFGSAGQACYNGLDSWQSKYTGLDKTANSDPTWKRILNSPYSPVKVLTKEEHAEKLRDKKFQIEAEIALIDEEIASLEEKKMKAQPETNSSNEPSGTSQSN